MKRERDDRPTVFLKHFIRTYLKKHGSNIPPSIIVMLLDRLALLDGVYKVELNPRRTTVKTGSVETDQEPEVDIDDMLKKIGEADAADSS
jgi:hypothetical protein